MAKLNFEIIPNPEVSDEAEEPREWQFPKYIDVRIPIDREFNPTDHNGEPAYYDYALDFSKLEVIDHDAGDEDCLKDSMYMLTGSDPTQALIYKAFQTDNEHLEDLPE